MRREVDDFQMVFPGREKVTRGRAPAPAAVGVSGELVALLRDARAQVATQHDVPRYVVASNRTLRRHGPAPAHHPQGDAGRSTAWVRSASRGTGRCSWM